MPIGKTPAEKSLAVDTKKFFPVTVNLVSRPYYIWLDKKWLFRTLWVLF